ncbi:MAG: CpsD/CapB family tyrosine-protein kinase [Acidobacteria bacterium]|nr:CpsD/CapB family tyrosine-protein kinase [Acidobacteriota bacterium]
MGRVYEALKRASVTGGDNGSARRRPTEDTNGRKGDALRESASGGNGHGHEGVSEKHPWDYSPLFNRAGAVSVSASTAHTEATIGSALPEGVATRAAGATLDAAGSTRALRCVSQDINVARVEPHLVAITQPRSAYCEELRSLRTHVIHLTQRKKMKSVVVTSTGASEGKSLTALNLAWLLAQTDGVRCLLIDSDLRQPCITDYLGIEEEYPIGLSEVMGGEATLEETVVRLEPSGLYLLPGGAARDDVAELLSGPKFSSLLAEVRDYFDYIIIDAPPLGLFTDATVLINRADGALMVVRAGKTRYALVDRLLNTLPRSRMLGVVLNRNHEQLTESDYYYNRRYRRPEAGAPEERKEEGQPAA